MDACIQIDLKRKHYVVGVKQRAIGKADAAPELQRKLFSIWRDGPGLGQGRLDLLGVTIDMDQVPGHAADHVARWTVLSGDRIQSFWLRPFGEGHSPARPACFRSGAQPILSVRLLSP